MARPSASDVGQARAGVEIRLCIYRVELEEITVRLAGRRTRAAVANFAEIISALARAAWELPLLCYTFREHPCACRQVVQNPVHPRAYWRVGIVGDKSEA